MGLASPRSLAPEQAHLHREPRGVQAAASWKGGVASQAWLYEPGRPRNLRPSVSTGSRPWPKSSAACRAFFHPIRGANRGRKPWRGLALLSAAKKGAAAATGRRTHCCRRRGSIPTDRPRRVGTNKVNGVGFEVEVFSLLVPSCNRLSSVLQWLALRLCASSPTSYHRQHVQLGLVNEQTCKEKNAVRLPPAQIDLLARSCSLRRPAGASASSAASHRLAFS